ncbi:MAG: choice-of-anchor D domain-containing protein, partial [Myxococcota bacterium]|nr:choice-of-anchor D domain-containing protein [Myxococcota bacterium]
PGLRSDADDDAVSIEFMWVRGDDPIEGATTGALTPPLIAGENYRCGGTPFDGQEYGETVWSNVVVPTEEISEEAIMLVSPKALDLGVVVPGQENQATLNVNNIGVADLEITEGVLGGGEGFGLEAGLPVILAPGESIELTVSFATDDPGLHKGSLTLVSNASNPGEGLVQLLGVGAAPCLSTSPKVLAFGGAYVASNHELSLNLVSCGALPVVINAIDLAAPEGSPFSLDLAPGPGPLPWTLEPGAEQNIKVRFAPMASSPTDGDGNPIPEEASVSISAGGDALTVPVSGFGSDAGCPTPVIHVEEGHAVGPSSLLHLDGLGSIAPGGLPSIFSWAVDSPDGAPEASFDPAPNVPEVTYPVEALGPHVFTLKVFDQVDDDVISGCTTASWTVTVKEAIPLIVELTWDTPGDSDQTDEGPGEGADLDLHMHRGGGTNADYDGDGVPDTWFDPALDVYWLDTSPPWGVPGPEDDPVLAAQDPDGLG